MATLPVNDIKIEQRALHVPPLDEVKNVLTGGLTQNFTEVTVEIVDCPDLTKPPFSLAASGLSGNTTVLEVGGPSYLLPTPQRNKVYDIQPLLPAVNCHGDAFVIGAGAGPWPYLNCNCEMMMNTVVLQDKTKDKQVKNETRISSVDKKNGNCILEKLTGNETRFALLANLFVSEGKPGSVIKVHAKKRTGTDDFIACMQKAIAQRYKNNLVGLGGTFIINDGKVKQHIMRDFSATPLNTEEELNNWLSFYNMSTPLVAVGTFVSAETDLDLRVQHFHSFSNNGEGGHYHIDTTPNTIEYIGYFNLGTSLYRVDQPIIGIGFGKD